MSEERTKYKQSTGVFVRDLLLFCVVVGFYTIFRSLARYLSNSIEIGQNGVILKTGLISTVEHEIKYDKINSVTIKQGLLAKMLNYGTITIFSGNDVSGISFPDISHPYEVKKVIDERR